MRRVVLDTLVSLDGFYTDRKNQIDWFEFDKEEMTWSADILSRAGTIVFGRTTYEEFSQFWPTVDSAELGWNPSVADHLNRLPKLVFSNTLKQAVWQPATIVPGDPVMELRRLKEGDGGDILILGSGSVIAPVTRAGLVDEYWLRVEPVILGEGKRLFDGQEERQPLKLVGSKLFNHGVVGLHYLPRL